MLPLAVRRRRFTDEPYLPVSRFFRDWLGEPLWSPEERGMYPVDIREEEGTLYVDAEMPGFNRDEIDVSIDNGMLTICAERKPVEPKGTQHLNERRYTRYERSFTLPVPVDEGKIEARLEEGILHLRLPQTEESKPRHIAVK